MVAEEMKLSQKQIDDIRVGAMLYGLGNVEITTQVLTKAVNTLEADPSEETRWTFPGTDLVYELGSVLRGAVPLLATQQTAAQDTLLAQEASDPADQPLGAKIISAARGYVALATDDSGGSPLAQGDILAALRRETPPGCGDVLDALERVVRRSGNVSAPQPALC
jgi:hypothetical protein